METVTFVVAVTVEYNSIQSPCRADGIISFKAQCISPARLVVLILNIYTGKI